MSSIQRVSVFLAICCGSHALAQAPSSFPQPGAVLADAKHKEGKSGVQLGPGNTLTIQSGVGTPTTVNVIAFSKDGRLLAAGKDFGRVAVFDVPSRKFLAAFETGQGIVTAVAISPDGQMLATAGQGDNFNLKLWHIPDGKLVRTYSLFNSYLHTISFSPDGTWMVAADNTSTTHVLEVPSGKQRAELTGMYAPLISPRGDVLMAASRDSFTVWNTADWTKQRTLPRLPTYAIPLALDPETDTFIVTAAGNFRILRLSTGEVLPSSPRPELPKFNASAGGFAAFRTGSPFIFGHSDDRLWAWNRDTGETCVSGMMYSESGALSPDGTILAGAKDNSIMAQTRSGDGIWIWDTNQLASSCFNLAANKPSINK
jgi:WD40 repeat protein